MAAELISPVDGNTGLPLLLAPKCEWLPTDRPDIADDHHAWHPKALLLQSIAGTALRNSLIQLTERGLHNAGESFYHRFFVGPELPTNETDIFGRCIIACAGFIPNRVIDLSSGEPIEREMTGKERAFLQTPSDKDEFGYRYLRYGYGPLREFFKTYTFERGSSQLCDNAIDEFLHTKEPENKRKAGKLLLNNSIELASDSIRDKYSYLRRSGMIHPRMPADAETLLTYKLGSERIHPVLVREFESHLLAA